MNPIYIQGIGVRGPGIADWKGLRTMFAAAGHYTGGETYLPPPAQLPPAERRRTVPTVRLALAAGMDACAHAGADPATLASVFTSSGGDGETVHDILETLASDSREVSPTRFHNSVHNAASGYWGIAAGATAPACSLCAYDWSFAAGLLEAATHIHAERRPVLLVAHDLPYPLPMASIRRIEGSFGVGLVLGPVPGPSSVAALTLSLRDGDGPVTACTDPALERLRIGNPAARSLPLLEAMAGGDKAAVSFDYLGDMSLGVDIVSMGMAR